MLDAPLAIAANVPIEQGHSTIPRVRNDPLAIPALKLLSCQTFKSPAAVSPASGGRTFHCSQCPFESADSIVCNHQSRSARGAVSVPGEHLKSGRARDQMDFDARVEQHLCESNPVCGAAGTGEAQNDSVGSVRHPLIHLFERFFAFCRRSDMNFCRDSLDPVGSVTAQTTARLTPYAVRSGGISLFDGRGSFVI